MEVFLIFLMASNQCIFQLDLHLQHKVITSANMFHCYRWNKTKKKTKKKNKKKKKLKENNKWSKLTYTATTVVLSLV